MAYKSQLTITRPANVTPYTAGDVLGGAFQFPGIPFSADVMLTTADLRPQITAIPTGMTSFRVHLYNQTPLSAIADNGVWDLPAGDVASYLGYIDVGSPADVGSTLFCQVDQINHQVTTGAAGLWAYIVTNGGFTPAANSEQYIATLYGLDVSK